MKRVKIFPVAVCMAICILAGCENKQDTAEVHYTMPPESPYEEESWYHDYCEWNEGNSNIEDRMLIRQGGQKTEQKLEYTAKEDNSKLLGYQGYLECDLTKSDVTPEELLSYAKELLVLDTESSKLNTIEFEMTAKEDKKTKYHFFLRYADKHRRKMVIFLPKKGGNSDEGAYLTDEEWLEQQK